ncbi:hypothetical protein L5515_019274 [Caenorhabditis briggsae]|uniref:Calcineurin-like phosphoesterase domain-containing protein n=1 Tax=Caenorhabditis briggsae TaxID=6238 RepID=A0AAE9FLC3_CAEBR|nr:hypothetical protein L5515_019274 [Caenorhabditis briggsae]
MIPLLSQKHLSDCAIRRLKTENWRMRMVSLVWYPKEEPQPFSAPPTPIVSSDALHFFHLSPMEAFKQAVKELNDMKSEAVEKLLTRSCALHNKMENVIVVPDTVVAVGDLHEVLSTLDSIFNTQIEAFVFAGDYVDRGKNGTEIIVFFL